MTKQDDDLRTAGFAVQSVGDHVVVARSTMVLDPADEWTEHANTDDAIAAIAARRAAAPRAL